MRATLEGWRCSALARGNARWLLGPLLVAACGGDGQGAVDAAARADARRAVDGASRPDAKRGPDAGVAGGGGTAGGPGGGGGAGSLGGDASAPGDGPAAPVREPVPPWNGCADLTPPAGTVVVRAHQKADQFFTGWDPGQNLRKVDAVADFPTAGSFGRVFLQVELECPADGQCDFWDRAASVSLVEGAGGTEAPIELARYMTPYRLGLCFLTDVTDLVSRLRGRQTVRSFIDTWVGPGHAQGHGWRVSTTFVFYPGPPDARFASTIIPLWNNEAEDRLTNVGDPMEALATALPPRTVTLPADGRAFALRYLVTGHGQGNLDNCAEFCHLWHHTRYAGGDVSMDPWRDDCAQNPVSTQAGTWRYPRAGWCPGAYVGPRVVELTGVTPGSAITLSYSLTDAMGSDFVNSCRPGAGGTTNQCTGCVRATAGNCDYDSGPHTPPFLRVSVQLLVLR